MIKKGVQLVKIDLKAAVRNSVEFNYYSALFDSTVLTMDRAGMTIRLRHNDVSSLLSADMECTVVFPGDKQRSVLIRDIRPDNGWLLLNCSFSNAPEKKEAAG